MQIHSFFITIVEEIILSLLNDPGALVENYLAMEMRVYLWTLNSTSLSMLMGVSCCFLSTF
jgi:hypothetical protein